MAPNPGTMFDHGREALLVPGLPFSDRVYKMKSDGYRALAFGACELSLDRILRYRVSVKRELEDR